MFFSCADSFREDLTSPGLEENVEKISTSADVVSLVLSCLHQLANEKP
jgi:hypothetical protein